MDQMVAGGPTATMSAAAAVWFFVERGRERVEGSRRTGCSPLGGRRRLVTGGDRWRKLGRRRLPEERRLPAEARAAGEEKERAASARAGSGGAWRPAASSEDAGKSGSLPAWGRGVRARP